MHASQGHQHDGFQLALVRHGGVGQDCGPDGRIDGGGRVTEQPGAEVVLQDAHDV